MANQLPVLHVNSTPLDAFLILNLLVFLPPVRDRIRGSKWVLNYCTCSRSASVHQRVFVYASGRNSNTDIIVDSICKRREEPWKKSWGEIFLNKHFFFYFKLKDGTFQESLIGINSRRLTARCSLRSVLFNCLARATMLSPWLEWFRGRSNVSAAR